MEEPTLYNGVRLANSELLARLRNTPPPWFAGLSDSEFSAQIAARIDAWRVPWERGKQHSGDVDEPDDDDELVAPVPPQPVPVPRRQRKRSLAKVCEAARKAGADRVIVDGVVIAFSPAAAVPESETVSSANEWDAVLQGDDHGPH
jgi:hypothetical protein